MYKATVIADSISPLRYRLTTMQVTFPRIVLPQILTHRLFSRNSASSRAIPVKRMIQQVQDNPFIPERFPINGKGMKPGGYYEPESQEHRVAKREWLFARDMAVRTALVLTGKWEFTTSYDSSFDLNVHKEIANRPLEPWMWSTIVISGTQRILDVGESSVPGAWSNFFAQRCDDEPQEQVRTIATLMRVQYEESTPKPCSVGEWHLPYVTDEDRQSTKPEDCIKISVARCARTSYKTHGTDDTPARVPTIEEDIELHDKLAGPYHFSPFEHVARPADEGEYTIDPCAPHDIDITRRLRGNFDGWVQCRKLYKDECR